MKCSWPPRRTPPGSTSSSVAAPAVGATSRSNVREPVGGDRGELAVVEVHDLARVARRARPGRRRRTSRWSPMPMISGLPLRATTIRSGWPACSTAGRRCPRPGRAPRAPRPRASPGLGPADQVREHLGVGVGDQLDAGGGEPGAERGGVVDDAVVHDGDRARGVDVRVGVGVVGRAVGGPAGVPDADLAGEPLRQRPRQVAHPAAPACATCSSPPGRARRRPAES